MSSDDFWNDPRFSDVATSSSRHRNRSAATPGATFAADPSANPSTSLIKQSVGQVQLTGQQLQGFEETPPKFNSWDGFWADPVFANVAGRRQRVPPGQQREFWKYEVEDSVSIASLFPQLSSSAFEAVSFRKSAIEWWSKPIGEQAAGLYLRTEVEFNGVLDEVFQIFQAFLGPVAKPTLRLSAYLGITQVPDASYAITGLTMSGSLLGLRTPFPPVLELFTVLSVGVQLNIGQSLDVDPLASGRSESSGSSQVSFTVFGDLHFVFPGFTGPFLLSYVATVISDEAFRFDLTIPGNGKWSNPLGVESLVLDEVKFTVNVPIKKSSSGQVPTAGVTQETAEGKLLQSGEQLAQLSAPLNTLSLAVSAKWVTSGGGMVLLTGAVFKNAPDASFIEGVIEKVTWSDIKKLFADIHGEELAPDDHDITCEHLKIRISKAQLLLVGALSIDGRHLASATILLTSAGISVRADVDEWEVDDGFFTINKASLTLRVGRSSTERPDQVARVDRKPQAVSSASQSGWYGGLEIAGLVTIDDSAEEPIQIAVTLVAGKQGSQWFWAAAGSMTADLSLRTLIPAVVKEIPELDLRLRSVNLVASSMNSPKCNLETSGYIIKQGFFVWATLDEVPMVKTGSKVKAPAPGDQTQLALGWEKGAKVPSVAIYLPGSLQLDSGPRFRSERFELRYDRGSVGGLQLAGRFHVRMDEKDEWYKFTLGAKIDPKQVDGELVFEGKINNPLGLSKEITIGPKLALRVAFNWIQLATTGLPMGLGFQGSFWLGNPDTETPYDMVMYVCENPKDMLIKVNAPSMDYYELVRFVGAIMDTQIRTVDMTILKLQDVEIYASLGVSFANQYYPPGFRFKGKAIVFDHEAGMDCSLTTEGFHLKVWLETFELGPLKVGGDVLLSEKPGKTFALLEMELNSKKQSFFLNGYAELFSVRASITLQMQFMPDPIFFFDFSFRWSDFLSIQARAVMISKLTGKNALETVSNSDWIVSAVIEQSIVDKIADALHKALRELHESIQAKLTSAQASVDAAEAKYKAAITEAQQDLDRKQAAYQAEKVSLEKQIDALELATAKGKTDRQATIDNEKLRETREGNEARLKRDRSVQEKEIDYQNKQNRLNDEETKGHNQENSALSDREQRKQEFMAKFGNAEASMQTAQNDLDSAQRSVDSINHTINDLNWQLKNLGWRDFWRGPDISIQISVLAVALGTATAGLSVAKLAVSAAQGVVTSAPFRSLKEAMLDAREAFKTICRIVEEAIEQARVQLNNAKGILEAVKSACDGDYEKAKAQLKSTVVQAQRLYNEYEATQAASMALLRLQMKTLENSVNSTALVSAKSALEIAKNNDIAFKAAKAGLEAVKDVEGAVYKGLNEMINAAQSLCNIRRASLQGTLTARSEDQKPFKIQLEGVVMGVELNNFLIEFTPGHTEEFLKDLARKAVKELI